MSYSPFKSEHFRHNLRIIRELVLSDFKLRYQGSYLGYFWTLIKPLLLFGVIYLVFRYFMPVTVENYAIYLLLGVLIWNFFSEATLIGMNAFMTKRDLVTKIYFSRAALVFASTISSVITLLLNLVIFFVFLAIAGVAPGWEALFFILYLLEMYLIATELRLPWRRSTFIFGTSSISGKLVCRLVSGSPPSFTPLRSYRLNTTASSSSTHGRASLSTRATFSSGTIFPASISTASSYWSRL